MEVDDRMASVLDALSDDEQWQTFEQELSRHLIRVYDLRPSRVRVDSSTISGYVQPTPDGLFQFGHSKDHRPDLPQVKIKLSALDPLGLPLGLTVVSGERADAGLYVPAIQQVQQTLGQAGLLYIGDCKMAALPTWAYVQQSGDFYLFPLSGVQVSEAILRRLVAPVQAGGQPLTALTQLAQTVFHVTPLSALQERIIALLGFPSDLYAKLALSSDQLAFKMSEP